MNMHFNEIKNAKCLRHFVIDSTRVLLCPVWAPDIKCWFNWITKQIFVIGESNSWNSTNFRGLTNINVKREPELVGLLKSLY